MESYDRSHLTFRIGKVLDNDVSQAAWILEGKRCLGKYHKIYLHLLFAG
jgi:hypothetical protein